jgi:ABC-type lipoprotein export system ATPase subunit
MPSSKFVIKTKIPKTFRVEKVKGMFDVDKDEIIKEFDINIPIENKDWNIGLIIGASGSGKTTIGKNLFKDFNFFNGFEWKEQSFLDDFNKDLTPTDIIESLSKVGFSSPPDWLKPFNVLSNGQKMRVELARIILESDKPFIYDEFTSLVDRQVAKIGSYAISKFIKKQNKKMIAITCHNDVEEWIEADWVYNVDKQEFYWGLLRRPEIKIDIRKATSDEWKQFKQFHYLDANNNNSSHKYIAEINGECVAWCSILHFPHPFIKNMKKVHRLVVKPDYQGIGLGIKFLDYIADKYKKNKFRFTIVTSQPALVFALIKNNKWAMTRKPSNVKKNKKGVLSRTTSDKRLTASFEYKY